MAPRRLGSGREATAPTRRTQVLFESVQGTACVAVAVLPPVQYGCEATSLLYGPVLPLHWCSRSSQPPILLLSSPTHDASTTMCIVCVV